MLAECVESDYTYIKIKMDSRSCYNCNETGHMARFCPQNPSGSPSRSRGVCYDWQKGMSIKFTIFFILLLLQSYIIFVYQNHLISYCVYSC